MIPDTPPESHPDETTAIAAASFAERRAIEVAAMLDDTVVAVKHLGCGRGDARRRSNALLASGAALVLASFVAFGVGLATARANRAAHDAWLDDGKIAHEFRPERLSLAWDWLAFGGLGVGVLCIAGGLWRRREASAEPTFCIGRAANVDLPTNDAPLEAWPLVEPFGAGYVINLGPNMTGELGGAPLAELGGPSVTVPGARAVPLPDGARAQVHIGRTTLHISSVAAPRAGLARAFAGIEGRDALYVGTTAAAVALLLAMIWELPKTGKTLAIDPLAGGERTIVARMMPMEDALPPEPESTIAPDSDEQGSEGGAEAGVEGRMGDPDEKRPTGRYKIEKRSETPQLARREDFIRRARNSGIVGAFGAASPGGSPFSFVTGTADYSSGLGDRDIYGGMTGDEYAASWGTWGSGVKGDGPGGGGWRYDTIGTGDYDTIGDGTPGDGPYSDWGKPPRGPRRQPRLDGPSVTIRPPTEVGEYDGAIIRREIKKHRDRFRFCYERQLLSHPGLAGTVTVSFMINDNGKVISATAGGMDNAGLHSCVEDTVRAIKFPRPPSGSLHKVKYPIIYRPSGK